MRFTSKPDPLNLYAEIAFPTAVRRNFTYEVPQELSARIEPGMRVWAPLRSHFAIGMVVKLSRTKPDFPTKKIRKLLDNEPVLPPELLDLTDWIHQFYYCSQGEVIQAALPAGMNYQSIQKVRLVPEKADSLSPNEQEILDDLSADDTAVLSDLNKRYRGTALNKVLKQLLKQGTLEVWEEPEVKVQTTTVTVLQWDVNSIDKAESYVQTRKLKYKWEKALEVLLEMRLPIRRDLLNASDLLTPYTLKKLLDEGWIRMEEVEAGMEVAASDHDPSEIKELTDEQQKAFESISESIDQQTYHSFLLYGVTGSGKTEVYIHALKKVREQGRGGIVLVPEIALTPQTVQRFYRIFGEDIAVLHSRMSGAERLKAWQELRSGKRNIAIGPRSALFAPVRDPGIIIMDEEHDNSYKQTDPAPRYHARESAIMRCRFNDAVFVMGSATPSMQALHMCARRKSTLLELKSRPQGSMMPKVEILDLKQYRNAMRGPLAVPLFLEIEEAVRCGEQAILLLNRRGFARYLQCEDCGHIPQSPVCSVSLTYHKKKNMLLCHYSGYSRKADTQCESCGSMHLSERGKGTERIAEEVEELFKPAKVLRFDKDTTTRKGSHERILGTFGSGKADILVGTQLVAKGLDFPNVTVVGVIDADTEQAFPSFQASERAFQLLSQVSGRSGRGSKPGTVFIQTRDPAQGTLIHVKQHDHKAFAREEMSFRKQLEYPPFSRIIRFTFRGEDAVLVQKACEQMAAIIRSAVRELPILGPSPSAIEWINKQFYWELMLKIPPEKGAKYISSLLNGLTERYKKHAEIQISKVRMNINVDTIR